MLDGTYALCHLNKKYFNPSDTVEISFDIRNVGNMDGMEVAQLYVKPKESSKYIPRKQLKAFEKVKVGIGEKYRTVLKFPVSSLASYDINLKKDVINEGNYQIMLGNSSEDIFFNDDFSVSFRKK